MTFFEDWKKHPWQSTILIVVVYLIMSIVLMFLNNIGFPEALLWGALSFGFLIWVQTWIHWMLRIAPKLLRRSK